jgi:dTDP-4-dehydrorhamnose reductase
MQRRRSASLSASSWPTGPIVVLGARGLLGRQFVETIEAAPASRPRRVQAWDREELDICDAAAVRAQLGAIRPSVVINAAAYTNVDAAESAEAEAQRINADGAGNIARACTEIDARLVHFSTDYVFDGRGSQPYREGQDAAPQSAYGRTKWAGELQVYDARGQHLVVRTSWLFGKHGPNFVAAILKRAQAGEPLRVVTDQEGSPTYAVDLVEAVRRLLAVEAIGVVHFANAGSCSWHAFACEIVKNAGISADVGHLTTLELARPAPRPAYSVLDTSMYAAVTGHTPPPWRDALRRYFVECAASTIA